MRRTESVIARFSTQFGTPFGTPFATPFATRFSALAFVLLLVLAGPAAADALDDAKRAGLVGEQANGYLAIVEPPGSAAARALVDDINDRRRDRYRQIARSNGIELEAVELLAGEKAIEKTPPGQFIRLPSGAWRRK